jgi:type II secretory pathway pseudopilin PulG
VPVYIKQPQILRRITIENKRNRLKARRGITLIENIMSMSLFLVIVLGVFEVFSLSQTHFSLIKNNQETKTSAFAALDKIRSDLLQCGEGFSQLNYPQLAPPLFLEADRLTLRRIEKTFPEAPPLSAGQTWISFDSTSDLKKGKELHIADLEKGEVASISSVDSAGVVLTSPLVNSYSPENTTLSLIYKTSFYLDENKDILRRKVNASPAQPLCEDVLSFESTYSPDSNLLQIVMTLHSDKDYIYEISLFPKNPSLFRWH